MTANSIKVLHRSYPPRCHSRRLPLRLRCSTAVELSRLEVTERPEQTVDPCCSSTNKVSDQAHTHGQRLTHHFQSRKLLLSFVDGFFPGSVFMIDRICEVDFLLHGLQFLDSFQDVQNPKFAIGRDSYSSRCLLIRAFKIFRLRLVWDHHPIDPT